MAVDSAATPCPQCGKTFPTSVKLCPNDGSVLEHDRQGDAEVGRVLDGKYRLDAFLSRGGMGAVYRATHVMLDRKVAVKLIHPELVTSSVIVRRFQREARAATTLSHPNIVSVYDLGQTAEGTLYIAMEFVDGPNLKAVIDTSGPIPAVRTLAIMRQLASALSHAHHHGIIHRDLKPHNVMLARSDDGQQVAKLVDFGIAKTFDEGTELTMTGFSPGTPRYMAPEQAEGRPADARSDLYSLGIVMYEMLTGDVPFNATSASSLLMKHIEEVPPPFSVKNPAVSIPPALEAITLRCLAKKPEERFQTADELGGALDVEAKALANSSAMMQATIPSAPSPTEHAWDAPTMPAAAAGSGTPPTVQVPSAASARISSDTRSTVAAPAAIAPAAIAGKDATAAPRKSGPDPVFLLMVFLMVVAGGALLYFTYAGGRPSPAADSSEAPAASPASAAQVTPPVAPPAPNPPSPNGPASSSGSPSDATAAPTEQGKSPTPLATAATTASATSPAPSRGASSAEGTTAASAAAGRASSTAASGRATAGTAAAGSPPSARGPAFAGSTQEGAKVPATPSTGATSQGERASPTPAQAPTNGAPAARQSALAFPETPNVFFQCEGAPDVCAQLRAAIVDAIEKAGLINGRQPARADIVVEAMVIVLQERIDRQFGTTFAVRNYSIELNGETTRTGEAVAMPPAATLTFDPQFGAERAAEKARLLASDVVDRLKAFVRRKRGA